MNKKINVFAIFWKNKNKWECYSFGRSGYYSISWDGFLLEDKLYELRGKYPDKEFEIREITILSK